MNHRLAIFLAVIVTTSACGTSPEDFAEMVRAAAACKPDDTCVVVEVDACGSFYAVINSSKVDDIQSAARDVDCPPPHPTVVSLQSTNPRCESGSCVSDFPYSA